MIWSKITNWFRDLSERGKLIRDFNAAAQNSFTGLAVSTLLEASLSKGDPNYKHEKTIFLAPSGFRIRATSGHPLSRKEMLYIGNVIINNRVLMRRLYVLGWSTLEIEDVAGQKGVKWAIKDFVNLNLTLN